MTAFCAHPAARQRSLHRRHRVSSPLAHEVLWAADDRGISQGSILKNRAQVGGAIEIWVETTGTYGKTDDERHGSGERSHGEHCAQCDGIRIARGPLCLRRQCSDECRRVANPVDQLKKKKKG